LWATISNCAAFNTLHTKTFCNTLSGFIPLFSAI
jgi:hypothetical protein